MSECLSDDRRPLLASGQILSISQRLNSQINFDPEIAFVDEIKFALHEEGVTAIFGSYIHLSTAPMLDKKLTDPERWLWGTLLRMAYDDTKWEIGATLSAIASHLDRSVTTVKRSLKPLAEKKWIILSDLEPGWYKIAVRMPRYILNKAVQETEEIKNGRYRHG